MLDLNYTIHDTGKHLSEDIVDYIATSAVYRFNLKRGAIDLDIYKCIDEFVDENLVLAIKHIYWRDDGLCHIIGSKLDG